MRAQDRKAARVLDLQRTSTDNTALSDRWSAYAAASTSAPELHQAIAASFASLAAVAREELRTFEASTPDRGPHQGRARTCC
jgi:hypothetical protein